MKHLKIKKGILALIAASISTSVLADDARLEERVRQLEDLLKTMQQQRAEQDKQVEMLTKELVTLENQVNNNADYSESRKKDSPVVTAGEGGFGFKSADGKHAIALTGRVQSDYRTYAKANAQNADTFDLRRAYLTVSGKMYGDYDFKVSGDFAQQSNDSAIKKTILDEAYFGINWWPQARLRAGQFNMPFGLENVTSDLFNDFTERAVTEALTPSKERGVMVHGNPIDGAYYGLALSTGRGKNANNTDNQIDQPEVIGRGVVNLAKLANIQNAVVHLGGSFSHGYISGGQTTNSNTFANNTFLVGQGNASSQTEGRGITFFTPTPITLTPGNDIERTRLGMEAALAYRSLKLQSEYITHNYSGVSGVNTSFDKDINAWYASANWLITGENYADSYLKDGTWGRIKPKNEFNLANGSVGAIVLGLRYSGYDAADFSSGVGAVAIGTPTGSHAWTGAVTWILNPNTRVALNYIDTQFDGGVITVKDNAATSVGTTSGEKAITVRGQFDF